MIDLEWKGNQKGQHDFLCDMAPGWTLYQGGLGSGKTWAAARKFLVMHSINGCPSLAVAPTYSDLWRVMIPELQRAAEEWGIDMSIHVQGAGSNRFCHANLAGETVYLLSADSPKRITGFEAGLVWVDEGARVKEDYEIPTNDAPTQIRARLRHKKAKVLQGMVSTTPEGVETWVQRDWHDAPKEDHRAYRGSTAGNTMLPPSYLQQLKATLGDDLADQYLEGNAVNYARDRAHATFSQATHVKPCAVDPRKSVHIGADFNVRPMCWVVGQQSDDGQSLVLLDEVVLPDNAQVDQAVHALKDRGWGEQYHFVLHPDRSSKRRSTVGDPEITVLLSTAKNLRLNMTGDAFGVNPPIDSRINLLCRMLRDASGATHMTIDPKCTTVIEDLEKTSRTSNGYDPGPKGNRGHILDALGYLVWDLFRPNTKATTANWNL